MKNNKDESLVKFQELLKTLFQFEASDLDFGIYRILNYKRDLIEKFINDDLARKVDDAFSKYQEKIAEKIDKELEQKKQEVIKPLGNSAIDVNGDIVDKYKDAPIAQDYMELKEKVDEPQTIDDIDDINDIKSQVYNDLYEFFSRYYEDGDFVPHYRYSIKSHKYAIPYNGEEVKLYWANYDQYYIKTGELFRDYTFNIPNSKHKCAFRVVRAKEEVGNNKATKERFFVLDNDNPVQVDEKEIVIRFQYRELTEKETRHYDVVGGGRSNTAKQEKINAKLYATIVSSISNAKDDIKNALQSKYRSDVPLLLYQLNRFTRKNTSDYFIHKNLKKFLTEQLDYFIKSDVLSINTLEEEKNIDKHITRAKVVKEIGESIIDFLAQIEDFQKRMWEKKKFVISTEYVITTDRVPNKFYGEIWNNQEQRKEWEELGFDIPKTKEELSQKKLPIDTKYFSQAFKEQLLEELTKDASLDDLLDGVLIKSENWQALNLLSEKYREKVQTVYIDPPYNTGSDGFVYKDNFQDSSWLTMMDNRMNIAKGFMKSNGFFINHIDDNELSNLLSLVKDNFDIKNVWHLDVVVIITNPRGRRSDTFSQVHEYIVFVYPQGAKFEPKKLENMKRKPFLKTGFESERSTGRNCFYPVFIKDSQIVGFGEVPADSFHPQNAVTLREDNSFEIWPITEDGKERKWRYSRNSVEQIKEKLLFTGIERKANSLLLSKDEELYKSVWHENTHNIAEYGSNLLKKFFGKNVYTYPKSLYTSLEICKISMDKYDTLLDFFAGSGTAAHAVMKLNKEDGGHRKFILVEMGDYFDTIIIPRIKKVAYSFDWKDGKPQNADGLGVFFKYQVLEQYEDSLDNIELKENPKLRELFKDEYLLKYFLDFETKESPYLLNIDMLKNPFAYKLKVNLSEVGEPTEAVVDIPETFVYLLGLKVDKIKTRTDNGRKYLFILGEKDSQSYAVVFRDYNDQWTEDDFIKDKQFIKQELEPWQPSIVYVNGQCTLTSDLNGTHIEIRSIEDSFKKLMEGA